MSETKQPQVTITINGVTYVIKKTNKSIIDFESMQKKPISEMDGSYTDNMALFYCFIKAANRDIFKFSFNEFLDLLDDNEDSIKVFNGYTEMLAADMIEDAKKKEA